MILIAVKLLCLTMIICTCVICGTLTYLGRNRATYIYTNDKGEYNVVGALKKND